MRRLLVAVALVAGVAGGYAGTSALRSSPPVPEPRVAPTTTVATVATPTTGLLLVWVPGGLHAELVRALAAAPFDAVSVVAGDTVQLASSADEMGRVVDAPGDGRTIPIDAIAVDCASWSSLAPTLDAAAVCELGPDEALLGETSAALRRLGPGSTMTLAGGRVLHVAGVVADAAVGAAELVVPRTSGAASGVDTDRYALVAFDGDRAAAEATIRSLTTAPMRVRGPGETPWLRQGDAVLPSSILKTTFGEFAASSRGGGGSLDIDPGWAVTNLVTDEIPVLGRVRCNVQLLPALRGALEELAALDLVTSLDRRASGCWNPRTIAGSAAPSRHAWGAAFDLIPLPADPTVQAEVVAVMERWGFTWGGRWVSPDPEHFEYLRPPTP